MKPPASVMLPSGRVVALAENGAIAPRGPARGALFSELASLVDAGEVSLRDEAGAPVEVGDLPLRDFHALRAIATRLGWIAEEALEVACRNCGAELRVAPCSLLELGPFADRELDDAELDRTLDLSVAHAIPEVTMLGGAVAREARFVDVTVAEAAPLYRALRTRSLVLAAKIVRAMGIASLGEERDAARIAHALARSSDEAWSTITDLFLDAHYPPRLMGLAVCAACGARNDVDAPYEREFEPWRGSDGSATNRVKSNDESFPTFDAFDARARAVSGEILGAEVEREVVIVVDAGVPAVDDGGEPLLGAYVPHPGAPEVTLYFRTFRAIWDEEGPYDWDAELRETLAHELEHHAAHARGHDAMDEEERGEIRDEAARVRGRRAMAREAVGGVTGDFVGFLRRTWFVWALILAAILAAGMCER